MRVGTILREPLAIQAIGTRDEQRAADRELLDEVGLSRERTSTGSRTSSPAGSASESGWPGRWP